jgi:hypothetical protein
MTVMRMVPLCKVTLGLLYIEADVAMQSGFFVDAGIVQNWGSQWRTAFLFVDGCLW